MSTAKLEVHYKATRERMSDMQHALKNIETFGHAVFEICSQTDRQTDRQMNIQADRLTAILRDRLRDEVMNDDKNITGARFTKYL